MEALKKNTKALIKNLETQVRKLVKQIMDQCSGHFSANTRINPKEHCMSITTWSGKVIRDAIGGEMGVEEKVFQRKESEEEKNASEEEFEKNYKYKKRK
jgi:hypothetical protein